MARKAKRSTPNQPSAHAARKPAKKKAAARKPAAKKKAAARRPAARKPAPPYGYRSVTPHIVLRGAAQALDFYKAALGAIERMRMPTPDGARLMHAEMQIGDSVIMMSDEFPEMNTGARAPNVLGATTGSIHLYSEDIDELFAAPSPPA